MFCSYGTLDLHFLFDLYKKIEKAFAMDILSILSIKEAPKFGLSFDALICHTYHQHW